MKLSDFLSDLGRPVAYYPELARALDDVKEAIFVCQMAYWKGKEQDPDGWIYKTSDEIERETALSYKEQSNVRTGLKTKKLMEDRYSRTEHRLYFRIDWDAVNTLWEEHLTKGHMPKGQMPPDQREDGTLPKVNSPSDHSADGILPKGISLNGISENTPENTPEITRKGDTNSPESIWEKVVEEIRPDVQSKYHYLESCQGARYDGNTLVVAAQDEDARGWLEDRITGSAERLLIGIANAEVRVVFVVAEEAQA